MRSRQNRSWSSPLAPAYSAYSTISRKAADLEEQVALQSANRSAFRAHHGAPGNKALGRNGLTTEMRAAPLAN
jgi:hypothetical protein